MILSVPWWKFKVKWCSGSCPTQLLKVSKDGGYTATLGTYFAAMPLSGWIFLCFVWISLVSDCDVGSCPFPVHCWEGSDSLLYPPSVKKRLQVGLPFLDLCYFCWTKNPVPPSLLYGTFQTPLKFTLLSWLLLFQGSLFHWAVMTMSPK